MASQSPIAVSAGIGREKEVSLRAGEIVGGIYNALTKRCSVPHSDSTLRMLNRFCVRLVFCLYAEGAGIFAGGHFSDYLCRASDPEGKRARLLKVFRVLDVPVARRDPSDAALLAFPHVHGGLFAGAEDDTVPMFDAELCSLIGDAAAGVHWADISPTFFGGLFESTINPKARRTGGVHYTSAENIHRVIDPLFLDDLKAELAAILAKKEGSDTASARELKAYCAKLASLTFLDPACGAGNFLVETFISLRRLENEALRGIAGGQGAHDLGAPHVSIKQFYGIESSDFAVAVAKTALWIAAVRMRRETQGEGAKVQPDSRQLESYDNIREANALAVDWTENVAGRHIDYIISNPPFVGYSHKTPEQRDDMRRTLGHLRTWGKIDYAGAWIYRAAQLMRTDPATRAAFVATDSIAQGEQASTLWKPLMTELGVHILFAYRSFRWVNEANDTAAVYCVIVALSARKPAHCTIFDETGTPHRAAQINSYLMDAPRVFVENRTRPICEVPVMLTGNRPADGGHLLLEAEDYEEFIEHEPRAKDYIRRFMGSDELITGKKRYCLWLIDIPPGVLRSMPLVQHRVDRVRAFRLESSKESTRRFADLPARFQEIRQPCVDYLAIPEVSATKHEYVPMGFFCADTIVGNSIHTIPAATLYHFGVLTSAMHMTWVYTVAGRLGPGYRYSTGVVYNNFPWPTPTVAQRAQIATRARAILAARDKYPGSSFAVLYDPLRMPPDLCRAHKALDAAVDAAYGRRFTDEAARVAHLLALYRESVRSGRT